LVSRKLYEIIGLACGFVLINYGFSFAASGFPGARALTSQFLGATLLIGGSAVIFISLLYLLRPVTPQAQLPPQLPAAAPDVHVELIEEEKPGPQVGFYKNIEHIGYLFTFLGLFSGADLVLQVLIPTLYNEARWWTEILLVTFGVLSYTILGSVGRIGSQEEAKLTQPQPVLQQVTAAATVESPPVGVPSLPETLEVRMGEFVRSPSGEFERHLTGDVYEMVRVEPENVSVWREDRRGIRSIYLAGPYELSRKLLQDQVNSGVELRIGFLLLSVESMRRLLEMQTHAEESMSASAK
jgi:hypothetical protein